MTYVRARWVGEDGTYGFEKDASYILHIQRDSIVAAEKLIRDGNEVRRSQAGEVWTPIQIVSLERFLTGFRIEAQYIIKNSEGQWTAQRMTQRMIQE